MVHIAILNFLCPGVTCITIPTRISLKDQLMNESQRCLQRSPWLCLSVLKYIMYKKLSQLSGLKFRKSQLRVGLTSHTISVAPKLYAVKTTHIFQFQPCSSFHLFLTLGPSGKTSTSQFLTLPAPFPTDLGQQVTQQEAGKARGAYFSPYYHY